MSTSKSPSNPASRPTSRAPVTSGSSSASAPSARRRAAKRRQAVNQRLRRFDIALPALPVRRNPLPFGSITAIGFSGLAWSKIASLALLSGAVALIAWMLLDSRWYVYAEDVQIHGQQLVSQERLYNSIGVENTNVLWLRRGEIRARLLSHPWITDAKVSLTVPARLKISVEEAPAIGVWLTSMGQFWISPQGSALPMAEAPPVTMPRLIDADMDAAVPGASPGAAVDTHIVASALALIGRVPGVSEVRYNSEIGLNFGLPGTNLWIYWGDGEQVEEKLEAIALGRQIVASGEVQGSVLDVRIPERLYVR